MRLRKVGPPPNLRPVSVRTIDIPAADRTRTIAVELEKQLGQFLIVASRLWYGAAIRERKLEFFGSSECTQM